MFEDYLKPSASEEYSIKPIFFDKQLSASGEYKLGGWRETQYNKVLAWIEAVRENMGNIIVCADVDVQFLKPSSVFLEEFLHSSDIAFQTNKIEDETRICSGFFVCRCSLQTLNFFEIVAKRLKAIMHEAGGGEQYVMQDLIDEGWLQLNIKMIPRNKVWNPGRKFEKLEDLDIPKEIMVHHANWTEGTRNKTEQMDFVQSSVMPYSAYHSIGGSTKQQSGVALCLSSLLRHMDISTSSIIENIIHTLPEKPDLFGHFPTQSKTEENLKFIDQIKEECNQSFITFEEDKPENEKLLSFSDNLNAFQRNGIEGNVLQWNSMHKCNLMKQAAEKKYNEKYQCVIWSRPDLYFFNSLENINNLGNEDLFFPAHDNHFCGLFDRFCLGSSEAMDTRMSMIKYFEAWYPQNARNKTKLFFNKKKKTYQWNPELVLASLVADSKLSIGKLNLCSGKIRDGGFVKVPFWHEIHGNLISGKACEEDIVNPEILRKTYSYENIKTDKHGGWFEVQV